MVSPEERDSAATERHPELERGDFPCRNGMAKRSRFKKTAKRIRQNGKHRRRVRKINW